MAGTHSFTRHQGRTPTGSLRATGPSGDHTTGSGFYMYMETSSPREPGDVFELAAPLCDPGHAILGVHFYYHLHGSSIGALSLMFEERGTGAWNVGWNRTAESGDAWQQATVMPQVEASSLKYRGVRGASYLGDAAVDDVRPQAAFKPILRI